MSKDDDIPKLEELSESVVARGDEKELASEAAPTSLFGAVGAAGDAEGAEGATNPYQPSISKLVARLEEVDVAPPANDEVRALRSAFGDLQRAHAELDLYKALGNPKRKAAMEAARTACRAADEQLKATALERDDVDVVKERDVLLAEYRETRKLLQSLPPEPEPKPEPKPKPKPEPEAEAKSAKASKPAKPSKATAAGDDAPKKGKAEGREGHEASSRTRAPSPRERAQARGSRRTQVLLAALGVMVAARVGLYLYEESARPKLAPVQHQAGARHACASAPGNGLDRQSRQQGKPVVDWVCIELGRDGALHAFSTATDPNGDAVSIKYAWYDRGLLLMAGKPVLPARLLAAGHKYEVEAKPFDGKQIGIGLRSGLLLVHDTPSSRNAGGAGATRKKAKP
ncbi:MAG: hypothetical protein KC503_11225 [Myxococcales bacterium]|nr:hypothetical protein [Myxococcales bacterium]